MTEPERITITKENLLRALWQAWYHAEMEYLEVIEGTDHPRLVTLTDDLWERIKDELPFDMEIEGDVMKTRTEILKEEEELFRELGKKYQESELGLRVFAAKYCSDINWQTLRKHFIKLGFKMKPPHISSTTWKSGESGNPRGGRKDA